MATSTRLDASDAAGPHRSLSCESLVSCSKARVAVSEQGRLELCRASVNVDDNNTHCLNASEWIPKLQHVVALTVKSNIEWGSQFSETSKCLLFGTLESRLTLLTTRVVLFDPKFLRSRNSDMPNPELELSTFKQLSDSMETVIERAPHNWRVKRQQVVVDAVFEHRAPGAAHKSTAQRLCIKRVLDGSRNGLLISQFEWVGCHAVETYEASICCDVSAAAALFDFDSMPCCVRGIGDLKYTTDALKGVVSVSLPVKTVHVVGVMLNNVLGLDAIVFAAYGARHGLEHMTSWSPHACFESVVCTWNHHECSYGRGLVVDCVLDSSTPCVCGTCAAQEQWDTLDKAPTRVSVQIACCGCHLVCDSLYGGSDKCPLHNSHANNHTCFGENRCSAMLNAVVRCEHRSFLPKTSSRLTETPLFPLSSTQKKQLGFLTSVLVQLVGVVHKLNSPELSDKRRAQLNSRVASLHKQMKAATEDKDMFSSACIVGEKKKCLDVATTLLERSYFRVQGRWNHVDMKRMSSMSTKQPCRLLRLQRNRNKDIVPTVRLVPLSTAEMWLEAKACHLFPLLEKIEIRPTVSHDKIWPTYDAHCRCLTVHMPKNMDVLPA